MKKKKKNEFHIIRGIKREMSKRAVLNDDGDGAYTLRNVQSVIDKATTNPQDLLPPQQPMTSSGVSTLLLELPQIYQQNTADVSNDITTATTIASAIKMSANRSAADVASVIATTSTIGTNVKNQATDGSYVWGLCGKRAAVELEEKVLNSDGFIPYDPDEDDSSDDDDHIEHLTVEERKKRDEKHLVVRYKPMLWTSSKPLPRSRRGFLPLRANSCFGKPFVTHEAIPVKSPPGNVNEGNKGDEAITDSMSASVDNQMISKGCNNNPPSSAQSSVGQGGEAGIITGRWTHLIIFIIFPCPVIAFLFSLTSNIYQDLVWNFAFPSTLWIIYSIVMGSVLFDFVVNYSILAYCGFELFLDDMIMDFIMITTILFIFLCPMMLKSSLFPDDEAGYSLSRGATNFGDEIAMICITSSCIVFNRLVERAMVTALPYAYRQYIITKLALNREAKDNHQMEQRAKQLGDLYDNVKSKVTSTVNTVQKTVEETWQETKQQVIEQTKLLEATSKQSIDEISNKAQMSLTMLEEEGKRVTTTLADIGTQSLTTLESKAIEKTNELNQRVDEHLRSLQSQMDLVTSNVIDGAKSKLDALNEQMKELSYQLANEATSKIDQFETQGQAIATGSLMEIKGKLLEFQKKEKLLVRQFLESVAAQKTTIKQEFASRIDTVIKPKTEITLNWLEDEMNSRTREVNVTVNRKLREIREDIANQIAKFDNKINESGSSLETNVVNVVTVKTLEIKEIIDELAEKVNQSTVSLVDTIINSLQSETVKSTQGAMEQLSQNMDDQVIWIQSTIDNWISQIIDDMNTKMESIQIDIKESIQALLSPTEEEMTSQTSELEPTLQEDVAMLGEVVVDVVANNLKANLEAMNQRQENLSKYLETLTEQKRIIENELSSKLLTVKIQAEELIILLQQEVETILKTIQAQLDLEISSVAEEFALKSSECKNQLLQSMTLGEIIVEMELSVIGTKIEEHLNNVEKELTQIPSLLITESKNKLERLSNQAITTIESVNTTLDEKLQYFHNQVDNNTEIAVAAIMVRIESVYREMTNFLQTVSVKAQSAIDDAAVTSTVISDMVTSKGEDELNELQRKQQILTQKYLEMIELQKSMIEQEMITKLQTIQLQGEKQMLSLQREANQITTSLKQEAESQLQYITNEIDVKTKQMKSMMINKFNAIEDECSNKIQSIKQQANGVAQKTMETTTNYMTTKTMQLVSPAVGGVSDKQKQKVLQSTNDVIKHLNSSKFKRNLRKVGKFLDRLDTKHPIGIARIWLLLKMALNLLSALLFTFYSSLYLDDTSNGSYIFVLFLAMLSFVTCVSGALVVKHHDDMVEMFFADTVYADKLRLGQISGKNHMQFYTATFVSLGNLIFRMSETAGTKL